jgi:hypothetical protein
MSKKYFKKSIVGFSLASKYASPVPRFREWENFFLIFLVLVIFKFDKNIKKACKFFFP